MSLTKHLGKIESINFGLGGYQESMLGLHVCFSFEGSGICTSNSFWDYTTIEHSVHAKWTEQSRMDKYAETACLISKLLNQAKVRHISELKGKPVEITIDDMTLHDWRILEEVL
jgi:hypothetical protein